jgi:hypothetical protein
MKEPIKPSNAPSTTGGTNVPQGEARLAAMSGLSARIDALREARNDRVKAALAAAGKVVPLFRSR